MALAFTSLGVTEDRLVNRRGGWVFRVSGELCHPVGSLQPEDGEPPAFAQLYIYDSDAALRQRMNRDSNLHQDTMSDLQTMLLSHHRYAGQFHHAPDILRDHPDGPDASVRLRVFPGQSVSQYALPTSDKVAVILPGDGTTPERHDILLRSRTVDEQSNLSRIDDGHPAYTPHLFTMFTSSLMAHMLGSLTLDVGLLHVILGSY